MVLVRRSLGIISSAAGLVQMAFATKYGRSDKKRSRLYTLDLPVGFDVILVPPLLAAAASFGVNARFLVSSESASTVISALRYGEIDLSLHYQTSQARGLICEPLYKDEFMVCARKGHPNLIGGLSSETYLSLGHVTLNWTRSPEGSPVDERLTALGIEREVLASLPTLAGCASVVAGSNLLFTIHARVAAVLAARFDLQVYPMPFAIEDLTVYLVWHTRSRADAGHRWVRNTLKNIVQHLPIRES